MNEPKQQMVSGLSCIVCGQQSVEAFFGSGRNRSCEQVPHQGRTIEAGGQISVASRDIAIPVAMCS